MERPSSSATALLIRLGCKVDIVTYPLKKKNVAVCTFVVRRARECYTPHRYAKRTSIGFPETGGRTNEPMFDFGRLGVPFFAWLRIYAAASMCVAARVCVPRLDRDNTVRSMLLALC